MNETTRTLEVSSSEMDIITSALETQSKILRMQASAGGHGALARLNEVKRLLATVATHRESKSQHRPESTGLWSLLRSIRHAT